MSATYDARESGQTVASAGDVSNLFKKCWGIIQHWRDRQRLQAALEELSDRELKDVGITRGEIGYFARSALSDDPRDWRH
jgi:uncharacterized protein YjiS (DUF1127 family)